MAGDGAELARRLLDAQTDWVVERLTGDDLAATIARDVDDLLALAARLTVVDVVDPDQVKPALQRLARLVGAGDVVAELLPAFADAVYDSEAADGLLLSELVDRATVESLVAKILSMEQAQDAAMERIAQSPLVGAIASRYVSRLVTDFVQQNREQAEKLPGVSSLMSLGFGAASRARSAADRTFGGLLGEAQNRGAQYAIRRTNSALREVLRDAPVQEAAMQVWDLQAAEPVAALREYLTAADVRDLLELARTLVVAGAELDYVGAVLDECVEVFFERYGARDVAGLLADLGITRDVLVEDVTRFAPRALAAAERDGSLRRLVRDRLEPFFTDPATLALLAGDAAAGSAAKTGPQTTTGATAAKRPRPKG